MAGAFVNKHKDVMKRPIVSILHEVLRFYMSR